MNFITTISAISTAIKTAVKTISQKPKHAALGYLHITANDDTVAIAGTDLTTFTRVSLPAQVSTPGEILAPAKLTSDIVKILPAGEIEIKANTDKYDNQTLTLSAGETSRKTISGMNPVEFPSFPEINPRFESVKSLIVDSHEFIRAFKAVSKYIHPSPSKQSLAGVHLSDGRLWASDGHRIAYSKLTCVGDNPDAIMNPSLINFLGDICPENKLISLDFTDDFIRVCTSNGEVIQRLIQGENLAYFTGPVSFNPEIELDTKLFRNLVELADIANNGEQNYILLRISEDGTELQIASSMSEDSMLLEYPVKDMAGKVCAINASKILSLLDSLKVYKSEKTYILPRTVKVKFPVGNSLVSIIAGEYNLVDLIKLKFPSVKDAKKALNIKASNWQAIADKIKANSELLSSITLPNIVQTGVTPVQISKDQEITVRGFGFAPAWDLPYEYSDNCLTVIESKHGFTRSEPLPQPQSQLQSQPVATQPQSQPVATQPQSQPVTSQSQSQLQSQPVATQPQSQPVATQPQSQPVTSQSQSQPQPQSQPVTQPQSYQDWIQENPEQHAADKAEELAAVKSEPIELLEAALAGEMSRTEKLLRKHYKTVRDYRARFFAGGARTWKQATDSYLSFVQRYQQIIVNIITQPQSQPKANTVVTVDELKVKYGKFADAKKALGVTASSWQGLADKINLANKPDTDLKEYATTEMVVVQLKAKYGKLSRAKEQLKLKAASWQKLAELVMAA